MKLCEFNINTGYRGEIICDEGYAKYHVKVYKEDCLVEEHDLCRFCLDRYVSDKTNEGFEVSTTKIQETNAGIKD